MVDRYADAVRARRRELRRARAELAGAHRGELRTELALARLTGSAAVHAGLRALAAQTRHRVEESDRAGRTRLPGEVGTALAHVVAAAQVAVLAEVSAGLRRIAGARALVLPPGWPSLPGPRPESVRVTWPPMATSPRGVTGWIPLWRLVVVLPLVGLPAWGGPAFVPLAVGCAAVGVGAVLRLRRAAAERAALHRAVDEVLAVAAAEIEADLVRRLLEWERAVVAQLDLAVARQRAVVEAELRMLSPGGERSGAG